MTPGTLANWRWRGHGPPYLKIGRKVTYLRNDVDRWKLSQRHDPAQPRPNPPSPSLDTSGVNERRPWGKARAGVLTSYQKGRL